MYQNDTILTLNAPRWRPVEDGEPGDWTQEGYEEFQLLLNEKPEDEPDPGEEFPYNRVRVVGPSPIIHGEGSPHADYAGGDAQGVIIQPLTGFDSNVDYPFGFIRSKYTVESLPEVADPRATVYGLPREYTRVDLDKTGLPSPEEVFAVKAPGKPAPPKADSIDPLGAKNEAAARPKLTGPLGDL